MIPGPWVADIAGEPRILMLLMWALKWHVAERWIIVWASYALMVWDTAKTCDRTHGHGPCPCARIRDDDGVAHRMVTTQDALLGLGDDGPSEHFLDFADKHRNDPQWAQEPWDTLVRPPHKRRSSSPGPQPLFESRAAFLARMRRAWDEAATFHKDVDHISLNPARRLDLHCKWLVRQHVLGETASQILGRERKKDSWDASALHKATKATAALIGLPQNRRVGRPPKRK
jgi:hypothetical protein